MNIRLSFFTGKSDNYVEKICSQILANEKECQSETTTVINLPPLTKQIEAIALSWLWTANVVTSSGIKASLPFSTSVGVIGSRKPEADENSYIPQLMANVIFLDDDLIFTFI